MQLSGGGGGGLLIAVVCRVKKKKTGENGRQAVKRRGRETALHNRWDMKEEKKKTEEKKIRPRPNLVRSATNALVFITGAETTTNKRKAPTKEVSDMERKSVSSPLFIYL